MKQKVIIGSVMGCIFGIFGYIIFKDLASALVSGMIVFMSVFIKKNN